MKSWFSKPEHQDTTDLPLYRRRARFLRETDSAMFDCLQEVLGQAYHVFVKVKLSELVEPQVETGNRVHQLHWIKVHRQTVDFLICRKHDLEPLVAIRLLPRAEYARRRLSAHDVVDSVLRDIGLPCITLVEKKSYDPREIKKRVRLAMTESQAAEAEQAGHGGRSGGSQTPAPG